MRFSGLVLLAAFASGIFGPNVSAETPAPYAFQASMLRTVISAQTDPSGVTADQLGNAYNFLGMDEKAEATFPFPDLYRRRCDYASNVAAKVSARDLIARIVNQRSPRVLVLNEAHHRSLNRAFAREMLPSLKAAGYNTLAVETLSKAGEKAQGEAIQGNAGYYSNETQFAAFLSEAKRLGFRLVAYEADFSQAPAKDRWSWREQTQADNLISASNILTDPKVKLVVYVGYGHVSDAYLPSAADMSKTFMSGWFKLRTGIDPLGISQTACQSDLTTSASAFGYQAFLDANSAPIGGIGVEIVIHPGQPIFLHGRGNWRLQDRRSWVRLPASFGNLTAPFIVEAKGVKGEAASVPLDRVLVLNRPDLDHMRLALPKGRFTVKALNSDGNILATAELVNR